MSLYFYNNISNESDYIFCPIDCWIIFSKLKKTEDNVWAVEILIKQKDPFRLIIDLLIKDITIYYQSNYFIVYEAENIGFLKRITFQMIILYELIINENIKAIFRID